jgi:hypothetical protein
MLKYVIFTLGVALITAILIKKGCEIMGTAILEQPITVLKKPKTLDEQLMEAVMKTKPRFVELKTDSEGNVVVDKNKHPDLYDWVVNG